MFFDENKNEKKRKFKIENKKKDFNRKVEKLFFLVERIFFGDEDFFVSSVGDLPVLLVVKRKVFCVDFWDETF